MKVIEKNKPWSIQLECTGRGNDTGNAEKLCLPCHAILEVTGKDIFKTTSYCALYNSSDEHFTFKCPCCDCLTDIDLREVRLPLSVIQYARKRTEKDIDIEQMETNNTS